MAWWGEVWLGKAAHGKGNSDQGFSAHAVEWGGRERRCVPTAHPQPTRGESAMNQTIEVELVPDRIEVIAVDTREGVDRAIHVRVPVAATVWEKVGNQNALLKMINDAIADFKKSDAYTHPPQPAST